MKPVRAGDNTIRLPRIGALVGHQGAEAELSQIRDLDVTRVGKEAKADVGGCHVNRWSLGYYLGYGRERDL